MAIIKARAGIPGTVAYHHADVGAVLKKGDKIAEIECMKTNFPVEAPAAGRLLSIVGLGQMLGQDDVLAEIEA